MWYDREKARQASEESWKAMRASWAKKDRELAELMATPEYHRILDECIQAASTLQPGESREIQINDEDPLRFYSVIGILQREYSKERSVQENCGLADYEDLVYGRHRGEPNLEVIGKYFEFQFQKYDKANCSFIITRTEKWFRLSPDLMEKVNLIRAQRANLAERIANRKAGQQRKLR